MKVENKFDTWENQKDRILHRKRQLKHALKYGKRIIMKVVIVPILKK